VARSLLAAMASGCVVLASDTEPHREVLTHGQTGLLVDELDSAALAKEALAVLAEPAAFRPLGDAAAALIQERYSQDACLPRLAEEFASLASARGGWQ
jgi:glycosyltransferase involved in cell wall biosynthesis